MPPKPPRNEEPDGDEVEYNEEADEDFDPTAAAASDEDVSSSSEDEHKEDAKTVKHPRKRKSDAIEGDLDSGDEATIHEEQGRRKKGKKAKENGVDEEDEESGGEGGFIRTRAQRFAEKQERRNRKRGAREGEVTVDVNALWAELSAAPIGRPPPPKTLTGPELDVVGDLSAGANKENAMPDDADSLITITRRIEFAGEVTEIEERVARSSKEAQLYLAEHPEADPGAKGGSKTDANIRLNDLGEELIRPSRRPSMFEPNPTAIVKGVDASKLRLRAPSRLDVLMAGKREEAERKKKAEKMTTVGKSALDWKRYVAEEGLGEEMEKYQKSRGGYLDRENFLGRAQLAREVQSREARLKG